MHDGSCGSRVLTWNLCTDQTLGFGWLFEVREFECVAFNLIIFSKAQCIGFTNQYRSNFYDKLAEVHIIHPNLHCLTHTYSLVGHLSHGAGQRFQGRGRSPSSR